MIIMWIISNDKVYSRHGTFNHLFSLYRERLRIYDKRMDSWSKLIQSEVYDYLVSLHFCLEFQINDFFREYGVFMYKHTETEPKVLVKFINKHLDNVIFWEKIVMFTYFFASFEEWEWIDKFKFINNVKDFCSTRNKIIHGSEMDSTYSHDYIDSDYSNEASTISFFTEDCIKQKDAYERILMDFRKIILNTQIWRRSEDNQPNPEICRGLYSVFNFKKHYS